LSRRDWRGEVKAARMCCQAAVMWVAHRQVRSIRSRVRRPLWLIRGLPADSTNSLSSDRQCTREFRATHHRMRLPASGRRTITPGLRLDSHRQCGRGPDNARGPVRTCCMPCSPVRGQVRCTRPHRRGDSCRHRPHHRDDRQMRPVPRIAGRGQPSDSLTPSAGLVGTYLQGGADRDSLGSRVQPGRRRREAGCR